MQDENAFGLLISYLNLEDHELAGERDEFVERYRRFSALVRDRLAQAAPGSSGRAIDLGHAVYVELLEDDREGDLILWLRETRAALSEQGYQTAATLTFAGTWLAEDDARPAVAELGNLTLVQASLPSEPLRRALAADAAARSEAAEGSGAWGPGLYLDVDAVEALGRKPKNAPSVLQCGDAAFYRAGA